LHLLLESANHLLPDTTQLSLNALQVKQINAYIEKSAKATGIDREDVLATLLYEYDDIAFQLNQQLEQSLVTAQQALLDSKIKLDELREKSSSTQINSRLLFSFGLLLLCIGQT
jgi:hypothetical protein